MINRDIIRIKVVQLTYAYYQNGNKNIDTAEKELLFSLSKAYDLYMYLLGLIVAVTREERKRVETLTQGAEQEGAEAPSMRFAYNQFAVQLEGNKMLNQYREDKKMSWDDDVEMVRKICNRIEESETYQAYMAQPDTDYEQDRELWRKLYKQAIQESEELDSFLEEKSLYWNDDKDIVDTFVLKTIKHFDAKEKSNQELLPEYKDEEDKEFARKLFRATILNSSDYQHYMSETSRNWELSRLAYMDVVIMQIAIAELLTFPNIPATVTINEYVELAKLYSTPRSGGYVNGMLDTIARYLIATGKMMKELPEPRPRYQPRDNNRHGSYGGYGGYAGQGGYRQGGYGYGDSDGRAERPMRFVHRPRVNETQSTQGAPTESAESEE